MSTSRKRITQKVRSETLQSPDVSQSTRRLTPPRSPTPPNDNPSLPDEITIAFPMQSFLPSFPGRSCSCTELVCTHRYRGQIDDNMLQQFLADTRVLTEVAVERHPQFFKTSDTLHIGSLVSLRKADDPGDGISRIYLKRENISGKATIIKFPASELRQFLRETLVPLYAKMTSVSKSKLFEGTVTHDYREKQFWQDGLVRTNPRGDIKIRPFLLSHTKLAIRMFQQLDKLLEIRDKDDVVVNLWAGPSCTLLLAQYLSLIQKLGQLLDRQ